MTAGLISAIASQAGISTASARRIAATAYKRYKVFSIPKRNGELRQVAQPAREVKSLQRALVSFLADHLPVHDAATGYRLGISIAHNALRHVHARYLLKMDFEKFFPSIGREAVLTHLGAKCPELFSASELEFISDLVIWWNSDIGSSSLCIGAPSSPLLSNSVMYDFDFLVAKTCNERGVVYTRYSDDMTFSSLEKDVLEAIENDVRRIAKEIPYPRLTFNERKRVNVSRGAAMHVTGLVLANQNVVTVGRERKRGVRSGIRHFIQKRLDEKQVEMLKGEIAFVLSVEPSFREALVRTYGSKCGSLLPRQRG